MDSYSQSPGASSQHGSRQCTCRRPSEGSTINAPRASGGNCVGRGGATGGGVEGASPEEVEATAIQLRSELLDLDVQSVDFNEVEAPPGAKGTGLAFAELAVTLASSGGALTVLLQTVRDWLARRNEKQALTITIEGDTLELDNISGPERDALIAAFIRRNSNG